MSLINEALRKTQQNRSNQQGTAPEAMPPGGGPNRPRTSTVMRGHGMMKIIVAILLFGSALGGGIGLMLTLTATKNKADQAQASNDVVGYEVTLQPPQPAAEEPEVIAQETTSAPVEAPPAPEVAEAPALAPPTQPVVQPAPPAAPAVVAPPAPEVAEAPAPVLETPLPPPAPEPAAPLEPLNITVVADGSVTVATGDQRFTASDAETAASTIERLFGDKPQTPVNLNAETNAPFAQVQVILAMLSKNGFENVSLKEAPKSIAKDEQNSIDIFLKSSTITGVRIAGENSKLLMNNQVFRIGDSVSEKLALTVKAITPSAIIFTNDSGTEFRKTY